MALQFLNVVGGLAKVIVRILVSVVGNLINMASLVEPTSPVWMYTTKAYIVASAFRDKVVRAFALMVWVYAQQNNPTVHVFIWILQAAKPLAPITHKELEAGEDGKSIKHPQSRSTLAVNRWHLAFTLQRNPSLRLLRGTYLKARFDEESGIDIYTKPSTGAQATGDPHDPSGDAQYLAVGGSDTSGIGMLPRHSYDLTVDAGDAGGHQTLSRQSHV